MAYVTVPKDLTKVKSKVMFGLTKRQLVCFGAAALIGVPLFFLLRGSVNSSTATVCMIVAMLPLFLLAMYEKDGQPLEVIAGQIIQTVFIRPKERPIYDKQLLCRRGAAEPGGKGGEGHCSESESKSRRHSRQPGRSS